MNFAITRALVSATEYQRKAFSHKGENCTGRLSQNKHFLSVHVRMSTLSRRRRVTCRSGQVAHESGLFAMAGGQIMRRRCCRATSIVFPPIILSKLIYDRLFGRRTLGAGAVCVRARRCACPLVTYLQMALGYDETTRHKMPS